MTPTLATRLPVRRVDAGTVLYRAHSPDRGAVWFGPAPGAPPTHRFHAPDGSFRTCFFGLSEEAAFAEGVLHGPVPTRILSRATIESRAIAQIRVRRPLRVLPLYGPYLVRIGATAAVTHGEDYGISQAWARAVHEHRQRFDGILYTSRHDDTTFSLAVFDRAADAVEAVGSARLSVNEVRTLLLLKRYGLGLDP